MAPVAGIGEKLNALTPLEHLDRALEHAASVPQAAATAAAVLYATGDTPSNATGRPGPPGGPEQVPG